MKDYTIGISLRKVREEHNFKQKDVAEAIGLDRSSYSFYETGRTRPSLETLCTLARVYNVTIGYLLGKEPNNPALREKVNAVSSVADPIAMLKKDEQLLLMHYRVASDEVKKEILEALTENSKKAAGKKASD